MQSCDSFPVPPFCPQIGHLKSACSHGSELLTVITGRGRGFLPISFFMHLPRPRTFSALPTLPLPPAKHGVSPSQVHIQKLMAAQETSVLAETRAVGLGRFPE